MYQAEWAGKLPWEIPGLEEAVLAVEIELRSAIPVSVNEEKDEPYDITMEDLECKFTR